LTAPTRDNRQLPRTADFAIIGGGIIGLTLGIELSKRHPRAKIVLVEKEPGFGEHASGRNSGVLHAGFYYTADSLKAKFTRDGNRQLTAYCQDRGLKINKCGKLVVARDSSELPGLQELLARGAANGVRLENISADDARRIEPRVKTFGRAIFSPDTSSVDPIEVIDSLVGDAHRAGILMRTGVKYIGRRRREIVTSHGNVSARYVVNAAGLYADQVARDYGFAEHYRILPFKGVYLYGSPAESLRTNVYPVPNLSNPFLGVHFTVTAAGRTKIGPTAIPAFWRQQYEGVSGFNLPELLEIVGRECMLFARNDFDFRKLAMSELRKYRRSTLIRLASELVDGLDGKKYPSWGRPGIRAQLFDLRIRKMEMDFHIEGDDESMHILNAVSPAFTCSMPFAAHVADRIDTALRGDSKAATRQ
jgi:L-2-hydroxyglutarate oxidase